MKHLILLSALLILFVINADAQIVINEIMYAPSGGEPEWVELENISTQVINLRSWRIGDEVTLVTITSSDILLPAGGYLIVTKDSSLVHFHTIQAPVIKAALPGLNNSGDRVRLFDQVGIAIDSVPYKSTWGGASGGRSLERIDWQMESTDSSNWKTSIDTGRSSPGTINSVARRDRDLSISSFTISKEFIVAIKNVGRVNINDAQVDVFDDTNHDSVFSENEKTSTASYSSIIMPFETVSLSLPWPDAFSGIHHMLALVKTSDDEDKRNDSAFSSSLIPFPRATLLVSEIMYEPRTGECEFVEYYNPNDHDIDLAGWKFFDRATPASGKADTIMLPSISFVVKPHSYIVLASDSSIFQSFPELNDATVLVAHKSSLSLGNDGDDAVLADMLSTIIDSIHYDPSWHSSDVLDTRGRSLERISFLFPENDPHSWTTTAARGGGTPGQANSVLQQISVAKGVAVSVSPNPFSPEGDGHDDRTFITLKFQSHVVRFMCDVFDCEGRHVRRLANNERTPEETVLLWDGRDDEGRLLRMGRYIIHVEGNNADGTVFKPEQVTVVLARKL